MTDAKETPFHVGGRDLRLLGLAAVLVARYQARRKSGLVRGHAGFPDSDRDAVQLLTEGIAMGSAFPLDEVPELYIDIVGERAVVLRLRGLAESLAEEDDEDGMGGR